MPERDEPHAESDSQAQSSEEEGEVVEPQEDEERLYFFPEEDVTEDELTAILASDDVERRAWAISHLLRYAQWDDIWGYVDRDAVREIFPHLELPDNLRSAWARMLKIETTVG